MSNHDREMDAKVAELIGWSGQWTWIGRYKAATTGSAKPFATKVEAQADAPRVGEYISGDREYWTLLSVEVHPWGWSPSSDPTADYEVLKHVRETWEEVAIDAFSDELYRLWDNRADDYRHPICVEYFGLLYEPGDYSRAALAALENPNGK